MEDEGSNTTTINGRKCRSDANPKNSARQMILLILMMMCLGDNYDSWFLLLRNVDGFVFLVLGG